MQNKAKYLILSVILCASLAASAFAASPAAEYLCEFGKAFYQQGRYDDALTEFNKVLIVDPDNHLAQEYINKIFQQETSYVPYREESVPKEVANKQPEQKQISREAAMDEALGGTENQPSKEKTNKTGGIKVSGEIDARVGFTPQDAIWKRANWDLNEKNFRMLSDTAFDRREDTFDTRIYDRLRVNVDSDKGNKEDGLSFHSNVTVDPWSFTGKTDKITVTTPGGNAAQVELKYWANTGHTVNEIFHTTNGDSFALSEMKVVDGKVAPFSVLSAFGTSTFNYPELKIDRQFQPLRELWIDYTKQEDLKLRIYPFAYENQALTFNDPLKLSNNHMWWEDSPWIRSWKPGFLNSGATPVVDFNKGYWDNSLSFFTRDSEGKRLTALRGFSFDFYPQESTFIQTSVATPKTLWQDYSNVDNILSATRLTQRVNDSLDLGVTATTRFGYNLEDNSHLDAKNFVGATDLGYEITNGLKASAEVAHSESAYDLTNSQFKSGSNGNAYHISLIGRFPRESIMNTKYGYDGIEPKEGEAFFTKFRVFAARMDDSFDEPLSSYVKTRDDEFWSRHLHFRDPREHFYQCGQEKMLSWDDVKNFAVGNGIDIGRNTFGLRLESSLWNKKVDNFFDTRNVHSTEGKFLENVSRDEVKWSVNDRLTSKFLGIYQSMPKTQSGVDPFIFDTRTRQFFLNNQIEGGKDPSIGTASTGLEYKFFDWMALNGVWECTNDVSLGYDNFPRGILNSGNNSFLFYENGNEYRDTQDFLFNQQFFPKPPYPYYNIFKSGLKLTPAENLEFYLDYTRNAYEKAGQVDDNMNHVGFQVAYSPTKKIAVLFKYTYSRWQDLDKLNATGDTKLFGHHNFFTEFIYHFSQDEDFTFQYGEASRDPYMGGAVDVSWDPYCGSLRTIDTQHIVRLYYRRRF